MLSSRAGELIASRGCDERWRTAHPRGAMCGSRASRGLTPSRLRADHVPVPTATPLRWTLALTLLAGCQTVPAPGPRDEIHPPTTRTAARPPAESPPPKGAPTASTADAKEPRAAPTPHLVVLGDSLTDPRSHGGGYLDVLRRRCPGIVIDNHAKGGFMMNQIRRRFTDKVLPSAAQIHATHLVVFGGVNDLYSDLTAGRTVEKIQADFETLFDAADKLGWKVVVLTVAPWGGFHQYDNPKRRGATKRLNRWLLGQAEKGRIMALETGPLLTCGDPEVLCRDVEISFRDGLHLGPEGHRRLGEALFEVSFSGCDIAAH
jgi:lysophospholipase L1-like esterase